MIDTKEENKVKVDLSVKLTKTQLGVIKRFIGLHSSTNNETSLKALIMAVGRGSIGNSY